MTETTNRGTLLGQVLSGNLAILKEMSKGGLPANASNEAIVEKIVDLALSITDTALKSLESRGFGKGGFGEGPYGK